MNATLSGAVLTRHWSHAFDKFGYCDGDGNIETSLVAQILVDHGYQVCYSRWSPHNTIIYSIEKKGLEYMPIGSVKFEIGYDDPRAYLPREIITILNET